MQEVRNLPSALQLFREKIKPMVHVLGNLGPGYVLPYLGDRHLLMFKREYYQNFQHHFPQVTKPDGTPYGYAQIMSKDLLEMAIFKKVKWLVFVTPDKKIYKTSCREFYEFQDKYDTRVPHIPGEIAMPMDFFENMEG